MKPGERVGPFEITASIGAGGMGEVYRARDTRLNRDVAIKILPEAFAADADRVSRFTREAQSLAALNHPHIAQIYGVEETPSTGTAPPTRALVMELVDGETLADRIARGAIPSDETVAIARQMAEALEAAHGAGIIHRDLKPANIKLRPDGAVKVLDFGLAKAIEPASIQGGPSLVNSPTLSFRATQAGVILGTAAYTSPEQARGLATDARSDVFSFGCVLFEMLSGRQAFAGDTVPDIAAAVLARDPDFAQLPTSIPSRLRKLVQRCLEKQTKRRWQAIGDVRYELDEIASGSVADTALEPASPPSTSHTRRTVAWSALVGLVAATLAGVAVWLLKPLPAPIVTRFSFESPAGWTLDAGERRGSGSIAAISPNGKTIAFTAGDKAGNVQIWLRHLDAQAAQPLANTEGALYPFWSPDSQFIAFFADRRLKKVSVGGGPAQALCDAPIARGGAWGRDGDVLFNPTVGSGLVRVSSNGGPVTLVTMLTAGQTDHRFPSFLPDGRHFLYHAGGENAIYTASLGGGESRLLVKEAGTASVFAPSGHLLYGRDGALMAQPFDAAGLATTGEPFPIAEGVSVTFMGLLSFSVSKSGTVVYGTNPTARPDWQQLFWLDREGKILAKVGQPYAFKGMDLSPDEKRLAFHRDEGSGGDVWIMDLDRGVASQLTFDGPNDHAASPHWSPDGRQVLFQRQRVNKWSFWRKAVDGSGAEDLVFETDVRSNPMAWAPDGQSIVFQRASKGRPDLWLLPLVGERTPVAIWESPRTGYVSPGVSRWPLDSVYFDGIRPLRSLCARVSGWLGGKAGFGGIQPRWSGDSRELFYLSGLSGSGGGQVMSVELRPNGPLLEVGEPRLLFDSGYVTAGPDLVITYHMYAVSRDGKRFLIPRPAPAAPTIPDRIEVIVNWASTLRQ